jgi:hypothetical protein
MFEGRLCHIATELIVSVNSVRMSCHGVWFTVMLTLLWHSPYNDMVFNIDLFFSLP